METDSPIRVFFFTANARLNNMICFFDYVNGRLDFGCRSSRLAKYACTRLIAVIQQRRRSLIYAC